MDAQRPAVSGGAAGGSVVSQEIQFGRVHEFQQIWATRVKRISDSLLKEPECTSYTLKLGSGTVAQMLIV